MSTGPQGIPPVSFNIIGDGSFHHHSNTIKVRIQIVEKLLVADCYDQSEMEEDSTAETSGQAEKIPHQMVLEIRMGQRENRECFCFTTLYSNYSKNTHDT
ncbi:hypothetical protein KIL84_019246 [Mauremys mutica]|uniref:Uncharacterized protein n=1 Tax=Mauremys mutica TaxID=74926 RepID=A0A9D3XVA1_9SAUR|nr:hypothetical protein KIL84_019246 [Mauremys mutica]